MVIRQGDLETVVQVVGVYREVGELLSLEETMVHELLLQIDTNAMDAFREVKDIDL